jgi:hypothetical protein
VTERSEKILSELIAAGKKEKITVPLHIKHSLHNKLNAVAVKNNNKFSKFIKPLLAVAAVAAVVCSVSFAVFNNSSEKIERYLIHESTVAGGRPVTIKLVYNAADDLRNVKFSLDLDEGISFHSDNPEIKSRKNHEWTGELKKGVNSIPFVVKTDRFGKMKIVAKAVSGKFRHTQEIVLEARESDTVVSMFVVLTDN